MKSELCSETEFSMKLIYYDKRVWQTMAPESMGIADLFLTLVAFTLEEVDHFSKAII